eukprot:6214429-Pleurochrysis_carterae.AAC.3
MAGANCIYELFQYDNTAASRWWLGQKTEAQIYCLFTLKRPVPGRLYGHKSTERGRNWEDRLGCRGARVCVAVVGACAVSGEASCRSVSRGRMRAVDGERAR